MSQFRSLALATVTLFSTGCIDGTGEAITSPKALATAKTQANSSQSQLPTDPVAEFHARNYADWVGQAHNAALREFFAQLGQSEPPRNICSYILEFMTDARRIPAGHGEFRPEERRQAALLGLSKTACASRVAKVGGRASGFGIATFANASMTSSYEMQVLLDEIKAAGQTSTSSAQLATTLSGILSRANQLVSTEVEIVYAAASVAQSSYEDWEANLVPRTDQVNATYGTCLNAYSTPETALGTCMGISSTPPQPTSNQGISWPSQIRFAGLTTAEVCQRHRGEIIASDIGGAIGGAIAGVFTGPGIFLTSLGTAATTSITTGYTYMALYVYCRLKGGSSDRQQSPATT